MRTEGRQAPRMRRKAAKKEEEMGYSNVALKDKIMEMYPQISEFGFSASLDFDAEKNTYIVKLKKGSHELTTHLDKKDADECMDGIKCMYLGAQIEQLIKNFQGL